jgi:plastocyanin
LGRAALTAAVIIVIAFAGFGLYLSYPTLVSSGSSSAIGEFTLTLNPPQILVAPGMTVSYASLVVHPLEPSSGSVSVTASAPAGLSLRLSESSISLQGPQDLNLNLTASSSAAPGDYQFTIDIADGAVFYHQTFPVKVVPALVLMHFVAFSPANLTVSQGTTVTWMNLDSQIGCCDPGFHTVVFSGLTNASSPALARFASWSYDFEKTGVFDYYCSIHLYMKGEIVVVP